MYTEQHRLLAIERLQSQNEIYKTLTARIRALACADIPSRKEYNDFDIETRYGNIAKAAAFLYWLKEDAGCSNHPERDSNTLGQQAERTIREMHSDIPKGYLRQILSGVKDILEMSESLTTHTQAYGILKSARYPELAKAEKKIMVLAQNVSRLVQAILKYGWFLQHIFGIVTRHNYLLKGSSALGLAGLYLNNPDFVKLGQEGVNAVRDTQGSDSGGGWAEGANYLAYAAVNFLPFFLTLNRQRHQTGSHFHGVELEDYFSDPIWKNVFQWYLQTRLPSGERPGVDDAAYRAFYNGLFATDPTLPEHKTDHFNIAPACWAWDWVTAKLSLQGGRFHTIGTIDLTVDMLIHYSDKIPLIEPTGDSFQPTQISPSAGQVIFRSGWNRESVYFLLQGESGKMVSSGGMHEHNDATSFILCAFGELLAIDPSYPGWKRRKQTNQPEHHSRILIDGCKPVKDAELSNFFQLQNLAGVRSRTEFKRFLRRNPEHQRNVLFINKRYFIIDDFINGAKRKERTYRLHGYAGGSPDSENHDVSFKETALGAVWHRPQASLHAFLTTSVGPANLSYEEASNAIKPSGAEKLPTHKVLKAKQSGNDLCFLTILYPCPENENAPNVRQLNPEEGSAFQLSHEEEKHRAIFATKNNIASRCHLHNVWPEFEQISYDGRFFMMTLDPIYHLPQLVHCDGVKLISLNEQVLLETQLPFHGAIEWDYGNATIHIREISKKDKNQFQINSHFQPVSVEGAHQVSFNSQTGLLTIEPDSASHECIIKLSHQPFHQKKLSTHTSIYPLLNYGDGQLYEHDGAGACIQRAAATGNELGYHFKNIPVLPDTTYQLSCKMKADLNSGQLGMAMGNGTKVEAQKNISYAQEGIKNFQDVSCQWQSSGNATKMAVHFFGTGDFNGKGWFKNIVIETELPQNLDFSRLNTNSFPLYFQRVGQENNGELNVTPGQPAVLHIEKESTKTSQIFGLSQQRIPVIPGKTYEFSFELNSTNIETGSVYGDIVSFSNGEIQRQTEGIEDWKTVTTTWTADQYDTLCDIRILADTTFKGQALVRKVQFKERLAI